MDAAADISRFKIEKSMFSATEESMKMIRCAPGRTSHLLMAQDVNAAISIVTRRLVLLAVEQIAHFGYRLNYGAVFGDVNGRKDESN